MEEKKGLPPLQVIGPAGQACAGARGGQEMGVFHRTSLDFLATEDDGKLWGLPERPIQGSKGRFSRVEWTAMIRKKIV